MKHFLFSIIVTFLVFSCEQKEALTAQDIIDKAIIVSGGEQLMNKMIDFDFRDKHYKAIRHADGNFEYQRELKGTIPEKFGDTVVKIKDVLTNDNFQRYVKDAKLLVADSMAIKYSASVNSVHYFVQLPYGLNAAAVNKSSLGLETIKEKEYYKIKVTFNEEGGGEDFEDIFIYWINTITFKVDYLAYSYNEDHGIGLRFREAYNERIIEGIRFADYNNYKPIEDNVKLENLGSLFNDDALKLLSKIETENVVINQLVDHN